MRLTDEQVQDYATHSWPEWTRNIATELLAARQRIEGLEKDYVSRALLEVWQKAYEMMEADRDRLAAANAELTKWQEGAIKLAAEFCEGEDWNEQNCLGILLRMVKLSKGEV